MVSDASGGHRLVRFAVLRIDPTGTPLYERVRGRWFRVRDGALSCAVGGGLRPPANYLEYIEAEQEHLPAHSRQKITIFSAPHCPDGNHPWADRHGVDG
eukprot:5833642-Prymnesium_polylepis.1